MAKLLSQAKISSYFLIYSTFAPGRFMWKNNVFSRGDHVKIVKGIPSILSVLEEPRWCFKLFCPCEHASFERIWVAKSPKLNIWRCRATEWKCLATMDIYCYLAEVTTWSFGNEGNKSRKSAMVRLPSISAAVLEKDFSKVVFSIQLNSNAYNQGLIAPEP